MLLMSFLIGCGNILGTTETPEAPPVEPPAEASSSEKSTVVPPVTGDPMDPMASTAGAATAAATTAQEAASDFAELADFNGSWIAIQAKDNRQVVHSICGTKATTLVVGETIVVENAFERAEQSISAVVKDNSGMVTITLSDESTLKLSQTSGILTATGWSNDNMRYVKESTASGLERIALFEEGCPSSPSTSSSAYQALLGDWIPGNEFKCATATYVLSQGSVKKGDSTYTIEDISNTDPLWLTVKSADGVRSGMRLASASGSLMLMDGTGDWTAERLKKRSCDRGITPSGPKKTVPPGLQNRAPKVRGR